MTYEQWWKWLEPLQMNPGWAFYKQGNMWVGPNEHEPEYLTGECRDNTFLMKVHFMNGDKVRDYMQFCVDGMLEVL